MDRKTFVKNTTLLGTATAVLPKFSFAQVKGSDKLKIAIVGCGSRGIFDTKMMRGKKALVEYRQRHVSVLCGLDEISALIIIARERLLHKHVQAVREQVFGYCIVIV